MGGRELKKEFGLKIERKRRGAGGGIWTHGIRPMGLNPWNQVQTAARFQSPSRLDLKSSAARLKNS